MKRAVILLILIICMPISYAKVVDIPGITRGEKTEAGAPLGEPGVKKFVYAGDNIIASVDNFGAMYYHQGRLSNRLTTEGSGGGTVQEFKSLPFGQPIENSGVNYPFTGKEMDESSLYYFGARYYDDNLGKFTSVDPIKENQPFAYVQNNPMNRIDPDGMEDSTLAPTDYMFGSQEAYKYDEFMARPGVKENMENMLMDYNGFVADGGGSTDWAAWRKQYYGENTPQGTYPKSPGFLETVDAWTGYLMLAPMVAAHETSHALAYIALGGGLSEFTPYPTRRFIGGRKEWALGYVASKREMSNTREAITEIAPYLVNFGITMGLTHLAENGNLNMDRGFNQYLVTGQMITALTLFPSAAQRGGDIQKFSERIGVNKYVVAGVGWGIDLYLANELRKTTNNQDYKIKIPLINVEF